MFVDSHCHLDFPELAGDLPALLEAMRAARVTHALCISVDLAAWLQARDGFIASPSPAPWVAIADLPVGPASSSTPAPQIRPGDH